MTNAQTQFPLPVLLVDDGTIGVYLKASVLQLAVVGPIASETGDVINVAEC